MIVWPQEVLQAVNLRAKLLEYYQLVNIEVLAAQPLALSLTEQNLLQTTDDSGYTRIINILGDDIPIVRAQTIMRYVTYLKYKTQLDNLGTNFLGDSFLYKLRHTRTAFEYLNLQNKSARQSTFTVKVDKFLLFETFL